MHPFIHPTWTSINIKHILTSSYSRGPAASLADFPRAISCVADPEVTCFTSKAPGSEHVTVTDLYDLIGQMHLVWSRSLTANAGSQHGSPRGIVCNASVASVERVYGKRAGMKWRVDSRPSRARLCRVCLIFEERCNNTSDVTNPIGFRAE